jgi:hypothetical protein
MYQTSVLYYKHMTIINDDSSIIIKWSSKLIDAARDVIYDRHMFIVHATELVLSFQSVVIASTNVLNEQYLYLMSMDFKDF